MGNREYRRWKEGVDLHHISPLAEVGDTDSPGPTTKSRRKEIRKLGVLVIDVEEDILRFLSEAIRARGHEIHCDTSCAGGIETFRARKDEIDVILVDYGMPKMTGFECAKLLCEIRCSRCSMGSEIYRHLR